MKDSDMSWKNRFRKGITEIATGPGALLRHLPRELWEVLLKDHPQEAHLAIEVAIHNLGARVIGRKEAREALIIPSAAVERYARSASKDLGIADLHLVCGHDRVEVSGRRGKGVVRPALRAALAGATYVPVRPVGRLGFRVESLEVGSGGGLIQALLYGIVVAVLRTFGGKDPEAMSLEALRSLSYLEVDAHRVEIDLGGVPALQRLFGRTVGPVSIGPFSLGEVSLGQILEIRDIAFAPDELRITPALGPALRPPEEADRGR